MWRGSLGTWFFKERLWHMPWCCRECIYIPLFVQADRRCKVASSSHEGQFPALHVHHTDNGFKLINYKIFSKSHISLRWFLCGSLYQSNLDLVVMVFVEGGILENTERKALRSRPEPTTNSSHKWHLAGIEPGPSVSWVCVHHCTIPAPWSTDLKHPKTSYYYILIMNQVWPSIF